MIRCRVLVVGGGPAGATAARFLAQSGIETVLLERNLRHSKPCGGGIPSGAFRELGIPSGLIQKKIDRVRLFSPSGRTVEVTFRDGYIAIVNRQEFDASLRQEAAREGALLIQGSFLRFTDGFMDTGGPVTSEALSPDGRFLISSDYVIAADGVNSRVRASMGMGQPRHIYTFTGKFNAPAPDACEFWLGTGHAPGFYSWQFPHPEGVSAGTGSASPARSRRLLETFMRKINLGPPSTGQGYKIPLWEKKMPIVSGRVLFAGDAAGHVMPLTFEGIYYAMRSALFAAEALTGGNPQDYERLWGKRFSTRFSIAKGLWKHFLKDDESMERFVTLCENPSVQEVCTRLWLEKSSDRRSLLSFLKVFKRP